MRPPPESTCGQLLRLSSRSGLRMDFNANGALHRIGHGDVMVNLFPGNGVEAGPVNIYLRTLRGEPAATALFGPGSPSSHGSDGRSFAARGEWAGLAFNARLVLADSAPAWFWHVEVENLGTTPATCDLIHTQDIALAHEGAVRLNEYFVSHYVDHTPLEHASKGCVVASRQNQSVGGRFPWMMIGSLARCVSFATDALQFYDLATRAGRRPPGLVDGLPGVRLQREHSMVAIQDEPFTLAPGEKTSRGFFAWFETDHAPATSDADLVRVAAALSLPEAAAPAAPPSFDHHRCTSSFFTSAPLLECLDLDEASLVRHFGETRRHAETEQGRLLSFFTGHGSHVALKKKELMVLRPHGHLLRSGSSLVPDEAALASTPWMDGVFHSMVTQGHVSINRFLCTCHSYLGLFRSHGQRVFIEMDGRWVLLDVPSAFEMSFASCRWIYRHEGGVIEVASSAREDRHELRLAVRVLEGPAARLLISHSLAINGEDTGAPPPAVDVRPDGIRVHAEPDSDVGRRFPEGYFRLVPGDTTVFESAGRDELLFSDGISRGQNFLCLITAPARAVELSIEGHLVPSETKGQAGLWDSLGAGLALAAAEQDPPQRVAEIFPWFVQNALVHYLSPRGLEQFSGGGWGTRDVCQGPVELLLGLGRLEPIRDILLRVFRQQNPDGDWPQWFMFFDRERNIRPGDSHGDIVYWPVLAVAQYLLATGDTSLLEENVPFFHPDAPAPAAENATVATHVERALTLMRRRVIPGTHLAAYGHGDWNDSLQPVVPEMRESLCSAWTVTLAFQTFTTLARAMRRIGNPERATALEKTAAEILDDFQRLLIRGGVVAGLAHFRDGTSPTLLLHPDDGETGLSYSLLPMIHAIINDMFDPGQAKFHLGLIREHLLGPDGARLFDRPITYHGGPATYFQRAESASYFGREIGLMYMHAHIRYAEALARHGSAEDFFSALCRVNPIALRDIVPSAALRQANCYYSSSDAAFTDRYQASDHYDAALRGEVALEGGWRVYSSGAGIAVRLIMQCFLGLRLQKDELAVDPAVAPSLGTLEARIRLWDRPFLVKYHPGTTGCGPVSVRLNGRELPFAREPNLYRDGAAVIPMSEVRSTWHDEGNVLEVVLR